ncbi:hypothetical protein [Ralstonia phage RSP15]|uniref:hypothetical protein n=1 Tax=Ralstonia phage RSP15 TaxID=1785960 RepID=UPI00074D37C1|nr:hypothetical protein BH754_gp186 [Ralstonia phage RSP15]BAU40120.1 hypothetical protein [Ralstonia phage RSP15]
MINYPQPYLKDFRFLKTKAECDEAIRMIDSARFSLKSGRHSFLCNALSDTVLFERSRDIMNGILKMIESRLHSTVDGDMNDTLDGWIISVHGYDYKQRFSRTDMVINRINWATAMLEAIFERKLQLTE